MEASHPPPEGIMLPPSRAGSTDSLDSAASAEPPQEAKCSDNVMITLSLTPGPVPPVQTPTRLPFSRSHFRSRSMIEVPGIPAMTRAHSSPGLDSRGRYIFVNGRGAPTTPADPAARRYLPLQVNTGDSLEPRMMPLNVSETIAEHAELDTTMASPPSHADYRPASPVFSHTLPRAARRRPSSPLHFQPPSSSSQPMGSPSAHSSPVVLNTRFNESYPSYSASSTSSIPSTPTSLRSRSPSISSLETIPDIPDAEAAAIEADRIAALEAAADKADEAEAASGGNRRRGASDLSGPANGLTTLRPGAGGYGARADKRKRWSVCGAERRQDLDLETIWED
ncbi:hypothetical protein BO70DRAFT_359206 [Aspergillus heteromorphus CBS 117.55]|uniref:Basic proline-rich protein n=1 Tax=Aspergillus heteromorphus CBS 117.55 TaxID=1448321 RepID=A0A317WZQ4_9EURO|nr:uncharacterized protein BO70DRAFT_359206 [Aspergillus heteromorphus CBS 117.55]PWY90208.1 hypothetical protein BO70DRAFT_359206 [Aspergillus heteromorphus CBS 117.55]